MKYYTDYLERLARPDFALPEMSMDGLALLDVGCANGWAMAHPRLAQAKRTGIDVDQEMIADGRATFSDMWLTYGSAEAIPFAPNTYDVVMSRVALPYTDIRRSLAEVHRVLKPGGDLFLTMHDWKHWAAWFFGAIKLRSPKNVLDRLYVLMASIIFIPTGKIPPRPWNGFRETFQTEGSMRRELKRAGFTDIAFNRSPKHWRVTARAA